MFDLPRSSWDDYDRKALSKGGMIVPRTQKSIELTKEAQRRARHRRRRRSTRRPDHRDPQEPGRPDLVRRHRHLRQGLDPAPRRSRRSGQRRRSASTPARSAPRPSAKAPTSPSPRPRGSSSRHGGGRINTDFIDNSAGVDCSDNEVNIKIPLNREMREGRLTEDKRNALLASMTDEVSRTGARGQPPAEPGAVDRRGRRRQGASRAGPRRSKCSKRPAGSTAGSRGWAAAKPCFAAALDNRGLTRPELAVVLSMAKLALQDAAEELKLADDPLLDAAIVRGLPAGRCAKPMPTRSAPIACATKSSRPRSPTASSTASARASRSSLTEEEGASLGQVVDRLPRRRATARPAQAVGADRGCRQCPKRCGSNCSQVAARSVRSHVADILRATGARDHASANWSTLLEPGGAQDFGRGDQA